MLENAERANRNRQSKKLATQSTQDQDKQNKKYNIICVGHHYTQTNTNNVNKTWALLQTTGGKYEPNIVFSAEIVTTRNSQTERHLIWQRKKTKKMRNTDPIKKTPKKPEVNSGAREGQIVTPSYKTWYSYIQSSPIQILGVIV